MLSKLYIYRLCVRPPRRVERKRLREEDQEEDRDRWLESASRPPSRGQKGLRADEEKSPSSGVLFVFFSSRRRCKIHEAATKVQRSKKRTRAKTEVRAENERPEEREVRANRRRRPKRGLPRARRREQKGARDLATEKGSDPQPVLSSGRLLTVLGTLLS